MRRLPTLPCYPCPHGNVCCSKGTNLRDEEAESLRNAYGEGVVVRLTPEALYARFFDSSELFAADTLWNNGQDEWATALTERGCVFLEADGACKLYQSALFPSVCRMYPWSGVGRPEGAADADLCPEPKNK